MGLKLVKTMDDGWPVYTLRREDNRRIATTRWPFDEPSLMIARVLALIFRNFHMKTVMSYLELLMLIQKLNLL